MSVICQFDQSVHESVAALHLYLRRFKIKQSAYYAEYHPRFNVATGNPIVYKTYDQYFSQDLDDKNQLKAWIKQKPDSAREWAINWLKKRKEEKGLIYAPSQVELRTLMCPSMPYYDSIGGYYSIAGDLGYKERYNDDDLRFAALPCDAVIIQDTREQCPLRLAVPATVTKVECGDYALAAPHDKGIYVERKSLNDLAGTMSKGNARFRRLLKKAGDKGHYIVMLVESPITATQSLEYLPQTRHIKASSSFVMKQLRDLLVDFPLSFQAVFIDGRIAAAQTLIKVFQLGDQVTTVDLQSRYEKGEL